MANFFNSFVSDLDQYSTRPIVLFCSFSEMHPGSVSHELVSMAKWSFARGKVAGYLVEPLVASLRYFGFRQRLKLSRVILL